MDCPFCRVRVKVGDAVVVVHRFSHFHAGRLHGEGEPVPAHLACGNPSVTFTHPQINPQFLKVDRIGLIMPVAPSYQCLLCGEPFRRGDLLVEALRVQEIDHDPVVGHPNVKVKDEAEYAHHRCDDRDASKGPERGRLVVL